MWFAFGLVTVAAAGAVTAWRRRASDWSGERAHGVEHRTRRNKSGRIESVRIGVETPSRLDFECKPETGFDRFFKRHGLVREYQAGHRRFDELLYLISDDPQVAVALQDSPALAEDVVALWRADRERFELKRLTCRGGRLWVDFVPEHTPESADALLQTCAPVLWRLAMALPIATDAVRRDPLLLRSALVLAASSGLAIGGALQLLRIHWDGAFMLDPAQLLVHAALLASVLLLALCLLAVKLLYRTSRFHLVLVEVLLVGAAGAFATGYAQLRDFNMEFDHGPVQQSEATVLGKRMARRKRSKSYYVTVTDWNGSGASVERRVQKKLHDVVQPGQVIKIHQHEGRLGVRWVEDLYETNF